MKCPECGTELSGEDKFCSNCGASISTGDVVSSDDTAPSSETIPIEDATPGDIAPIDDVEAAVSELPEPELPEPEPILDEDAQLEEFEPLQPAQETVVESLPAEEPVPDLEPVVPPPPPPPVVKAKSKSNTGLIIAIVVLVLLLLCCCCAIGIIVANFDQISSALEAYY